MNAATSCPPHGGPAARATKELGVNYGKRGVSVADGGANATIGGALRVALVAVGDGASAVGLANNRGKSKGPFFPV